MMDGGAISRKRHNVLYITMVWLLLAPMACTLTDAPSSADQPSPAVRFIRGGNAQFEIISPRDQRVLIDVISPMELSKPPDAQDILLTTHLHMDHYSKLFVDGFPGRQLLLSQGEIQRPGLFVRGIPSRHTCQASDEFKPSSGSNYIYLVEAAGLRIAHFGDIGQNRLTGAQLDALGRVDVAITQFCNSFSWMDLSNQKGRG